MLTQLPAGARILRVEETEDMNTMPRTALVVIYRGKGGIYRMSHFCIETGDYLGEVV